MSTGTIPSNPAQGGLIFKRLDFERLQALAETHVGYQRALTLSKHIVANWSSELQATLAELGINILGFEAIVEGDVPDPPFTGVTGAVGVTVFWLATATDVSLNNPHCYVFTLQGEGGPTALGSDPESGPTEGSVFVGHFGGDPSTVTPEYWCTSLSASMLDVDSPTDGPILGEFAAYEIADQPLLWGLDEVWYAFGGGLTLEGDATWLTVRYRNVRYRHFEWLLAVLGLQLPPGDVGFQPPRHRFFERGIVAVPLWGPDAGQEIGGDFTIGSRFELTASVGDGGTNNPDDVRALRQRLVGLGYDWLTVNDTIDDELKTVINLVQSITRGRNIVSGDGRVDVPGPTYDWLRATNAPRWQLMPEGGEGDGFINFERQDTGENFDYGTDWMAETITGAGADYRDDYLTDNPDATPLTVNDVSKPQGGPAPPHTGHQTGMACDLRLPRTDGTAGGITWNDPNYDQDAMRAMLRAIWAQQNVSRVLFNDPTLIDEGLCQQAPGHNNHVHFDIEPSTPIIGQVGSGSTTTTAVPARYGGSPLWYNITGRQDDIRQLQSDLWNLGFWFPEMIAPAHRGNYSYTPGQQQQLPTNQAAGDYNAQTVWAVREFQIYAGMDRVAQHNGGNANRYVDNLDATNNTAPYTGPTTGVFDGATAQALQHWRSNDLRCPVVVEARTGPNHVNVVAQNIWVRNAETRQNPRMFTYDVSDYYTIPANRLHFQDAQGEGSVVTGDYVPNGPRSIYPNHVLPEAEFTPENLIGVNRNQLNANNAMQATYKVVRAVSEQECMGFGDSVNSWDAQVVSIGPCHWTYRLGHIQGANQPVNAGELGSYFSYLASAHGDRPAFDQAIGRFGVDIDTQWGNDGANLFGGQRKYVDQFRLRYRVGDPADPARTAFSRVLGRDRNYFRTWHWFHRFEMAGRFVNGFRQRMWHMARLRLRDISETVIGPPVQNVGGAGGRQARIGDVFASELAMALLLRWHIYRPAYITAAGNAGNSVEDAFDIASARAPAGVNLNQDPTAWVHNNAYGDTLANGIIDRVANNTFNTNNMNGRQVRNGAGTLFESNPGVPIQNRGAVLVEGGQRWEWRGAAAVANFANADHKRGLLLSLNRVLNWPAGANALAGNHPGPQTVYQTLGALDSQHGSFELDYTGLPRGHPYPNPVFDPR